MALPHAVRLRTPRCFCTLRVKAALLGIAAAPLLLISAAQAQFRASIQGVVTDPGGAVIPGATLLLTDTATNEKRVTTSNQEGVYNFSALPPDRFTLVIKKDGFQTRTLDNVQIIPEQSNALNIQMTVGSVAQSVTVNAAQTPLIDTQNAAIGGTISANEIQHMPSFGRDVFQLTQLTPGAFGDASQAAGGGTFSLPGTKGPGGPGANTGIFATENGPQTLANGGQYENNGISIDGISTASAVWGGTSVVTPTEESVANVKVLANDYDAENGRFSGAQIEVTSKSGTNHLHGSAFFQAHRPGLNAYQRYNGPSYYDSGTPAARGLLKDTQQFNQYGGSLGGPIWKNRVFAFIAYETERNNSQVTGTGWYDTSGFDKLAPSGSIASQFLSISGAAVNSAGVIDQTCANIGLSEGTNCITIPGKGLNLGSPLSSGLGTQDLTWSSPFSPGVGSGLDPSVADIADYTTVNPTSVVEGQYNGRLDADVTGKDHLAFAIYWVPISQTYYNGPVRAYNLWHHSATNDAYSAIWNHTFSPTLLNEARANAAGWRWNEVSGNPQEPFGLPQDNIGQIGDLNSSAPGSPTLNYFGAPGPSVFDQWTYSYNDVLIKTAGRHSIKFGGELTRLYYLNEVTAGARPTFGFFNLWDFLNDAPMSESGTFNPSSGAPTAGRQDDREDLWGFFVQDDWKVMPNLTLNLGLRYSYFGPLSAKQGDLYSVSLGSGSAMLSGMTIREGGNLWQAQKGNFGPQFGFAWSPRVLDNRMVVRGGFGLNYNQEEIAISANAYANPGLTVSPNFTMNLPSSPNPGIVYAVPADVHSLFGYPPNPNTVVAFGSNGLPATGQVGVSAFDANLPTMYTEHYSLQTEYNLGRQFVASLGYEGSQSRHTFFHYEENAVASVQGVALNPRVNSVNFYGNGGNANYNALLAGVRHDFSRQFMADAQFTWAKSMDDSSDPYTDQYYPYDPGLTYGRSDYDIGKALKLYGMWEPVFFRGRHSWLEKVVGGWSVSGIFNLHSGFPWSPVISTVGGSLYCSTCGYTQLLPAAYLGGAGHDTSNDAYKSGPGVGSGVNKNFPLAATAPNAAEVYFAPPAYAPGPAFPATGGAPPQSPGVARNSWTGPGYRDVDASLIKSFGLPAMPVLGEDANFEFRADFYNLFNNLNFNPGSISTNIQAANFGQAQSALGARTISLEARFSF
ncbi:MAG TPA: TonB-dependent receptor [Terracidiphilus sp.]|nr:TonB-dependent receptor [Terracidiphilus sp.]